MRGTRWVTIMARVLPALFALLLISPAAALARPQQMHIMEGFLPWQWAAFWYLLTIPFWILGFRRISRLVTDKPEIRLLLGLAGAFCFVLSALKLPSVAGSSSHPTGTGLGAVLFGPWVMSVLGSIVLLFQALLLAHGGLTTLGANALSMAVAGPFVSWATWRCIGLLSRPGLAAFAAAALGDVATYAVTSLQLALAYPDPVGGIGASLAKFALIFAMPQIPLAISEGILTVLMLRALRSHAPEDLEALGIAGF